MRVFVYGTLLRGLERNDALGASRYLGPALIHATLYDLGSYPGIKRGSTPVAGEIYEVDASTLGRLDAIEDYYPTDPAASLYLRKTVQARCLEDGSDVDVFAYFYAPPIEGCTLIAHGDYRRHRLASQSSRRARTEGESA